MKGRTDLLVAALIVSLAVHFGGMFWARPQVMTRVAAGSPQGHRRGTMRVTEAPPPPESVRIAVIRDEKPEREAPTVDETIAVLPAAEASLPTEPVARQAPGVAALPEFASVQVPDADRPTFEYAPTPGVPETSAPRMTIDAPSVVRVSGAVADLDTPENAPPAPAFEAPVFAPVGRIRDIAPDGGDRERAEESGRTDKISPVMTAEEEEEAKKPAFKPAEEVMAKVDEQVVETEKKAVRRLLNAQGAADIATLVGVSLETFREGNYTYFRATVAPKPRLPAVPKDFVVILDASGSIGNDRLASCRKAAKEILRTAANTGDRFNLVAFRDRFSYCFKSWRPCDADSFEEGDRWLSKLAAHGRTDVFSTIASVLTLPRDPARPLIALVVTDGDANTGVSETSQILAKFTKLNDGLVSVYMYGVKSSANRELIDILTHGNRGESFVFDGWRRYAGKNIGALSERFRDPVVTDLRVVFPSTCPAEAYPQILRNVYRGNTVMVTGRVAGSPAEIAFSLRGLVGATAYEGFFRAPVAGSVSESDLPAAWRTERGLDARLR